MELGMILGEIQRPTLDELFQAVRDYGFTQVQFGYASVCVTDMPQRLEPAFVQSIRIQARASGIEIAALAAAWNVRCILLVWGTGITVAASLHFISALPQQPPSLNPSPNWLEYDRTENPLRDEMLPLTLEDGAIRTPVGPGLGVTPDPAWLEQYRCDR